MSSAYQAGAAAYQHLRTEDGLDEDLPLEERCEDDRCKASTSTVWHCVDCDSNYCSDCWGYQGPHKAGKLGRDGVPHERTDVKVVSRLKKVLQPSESADAIRKAHEIDQSTKWFGVSRDVTGRPSLDDYGRYATLMASLQPTDQTRSRFPQLVSFIGVTNAGKSTIIKLLVNQKHRGEVATADFPTPVVGSITHDKVPTSGDVHLYADRSTHFGSLPVLFADCEGFEGGEKTPLGARLKKRPNSDPRVVQPEYAQARSLPIEWADSEESRQREFAVRELYPRLLYTFSDVVVFVLRNAKQVHRSMLLFWFDMLTNCSRTFQSAVLTKLLDWGAAALEKSLNQPSLPHAIVILNDTEPGVDEREWETDFATRSLLASVNGALDYVEGVPRFRDLAAYWRGLGKQIDTVEDLVLRYYSSFKVVRVPRKPRYMLIDRQIQRLHDEIVADCDASFKAKRKARMLTNSDELNTYLQCAFEHFTRTLATPFNFVAVSLLNNPISYDFGGHMLQLANTVAAQDSSNHKATCNSRWIFESMSGMIASCIMLDCTRYRKGRVEDLFDNYQKFFTWTLREYCEMWLPCSYSNGEGRHCMLVKARHTIKGHQDEQGIIAHGEYQSELTAEEFGLTWERQLRSSISVVQRAFQCEQDHVCQSNNAVSDEKIALRLHRQYANEFFTKVGSPDKIFSHASCFCCLMEVPEHLLPCGHVLCEACVHTYGKASGKCVVEIPYCPLHMEDTHWVQPHLIKFKHKGAGTRVLCLDGGGIRGIVELEVLRAIEQALGGEIPVQAFFDLIVGTSTGGIIALALGVQQWPVDQCIEMFVSLCDSAYTPRLKGMPLLDLAASIGHGSRYKTREFHRTLRHAFGEKEYLFGGKGENVLQARTKVAVTSTSGTGGRAILIANYRRKEDSKPEYDFERPHEPELEMRVWEAAAATSAAPTYFKPFINPLTRRTYLDGALQNNNPARLANIERKLIWPEAADADPDILLSLGTGQNRISILPKLSAKSTDWRTLQSTLQPSSIERPKGITKLLKPWNVLYSRVDDILNAEMAWAAFRSDVVAPDRTLRNTRRYIRFNPDLAKQAPSVDAKNEIRSLQSTVKKRLTTPHCLTAVQHVAYRLVASSFFLDVVERTTCGDGSHLFQCCVLCRFENGSDNLRALGRYMTGACTKDFRPFLVIKGDTGSDEETVIDFSSTIMSRMTDDAIFAMPTVAIAVEDDSKLSNVSLVLSSYDGLEPDGFSLSGLPKVLANEGVIRFAQRTSGANKSGPPVVRSSPTPSLSSRSNTPSESVPRADVVSPNHGASRKHLWAPNAGPLAGLKQAEPTDEVSEQHAADTLNALPSTSYRDVKGPNRFWTYIGPSHMAKHRHLYSQDVLQKFVPSVAAEPVELDAGDEAEVKRFTHAELTNSPRPGQSRRNSIRPELCIGRSPTPLLRERKDSVAELSDAQSVNEAVIGDIRIKLPPLPFAIPPAFPQKKRGFDPSALEAAIEAAFN